VLKDLVEADAAGRLGVHVVWLPMVPGDNEETARLSAELFSGLEVHQYYDAQRVVGLSYHRDVFPDCLVQAVRATPPTHPLHGELTDRAEGEHRDYPLWDAVLFYPDGIQWRDQPPTPAHWSKQIAFFAGEPNGGESVGADAVMTGTFFRDVCAAPPVDSDWLLEVRRGRQRIMTHQDRDSD